MLVSNNVICFGYFIPMSHGVIKKISPILSLIPSPYQVFTRFICCFTKNTLSTIFCSDQIIAKIMHFQTKPIFFFQLIAGPVLILLFCVYVFFKGAFHSSAIMKLQIASYLIICIAFYLASHQIVWPNGRIHGHCLEITSCCYFFRFPSKLSSRLILPP